MTFYQELQLNQAGSKQLIRNANTLKEKFYHIAVYLFKLFITMVFCMAVVIGYSILFGNDNSIVGVVVLLCVMVFRNVDLDFDTSHALPTLMIIFAIMAFGPHLANTSPLFIGLLINLVCIGALVFLGCHNVMMFNHSTLVLGYLLLHEYDVSGILYTKRLIGMAIGALITGMIYYRNHRKKSYTKTFHHLIQEYDLRSSRTQWQLCLTLGVSSVLFLAKWFHLPKVVWVGIATMSILTPFTEDMKPRAKQRIPGNIVGGILCFIIYNYCPSFIYNNIGILGGIGVGLSVTYGWQSIFNTFGSIPAAAGFLGLPGAIFYRIFNNVLGIIYGLAFHKIFHRSMNRSSVSL